ncbi:copper amine oxidase N-terminal domain-containing protein [Paenibacillus agri]|uniref:Copper amine oxidase N-terminal domain-containing protein n=1 Tax=Paenibacillus agri TaxID=2744309 RepID=A0A850EIH6_9BACL|nr:copper amine oxidase N-terminal domain-containing protein [Paenibacillus agri]NUU59214.1 copper amine oxidase N-terminal domain-containing protein [Paenibacillus agri]
MVLSKLAVYGAAIIFITSVGCSLVSGSALAAPAGTESATLSPAAPTEQTRRSLEHAGFRQQGAVYLPLKEMAPLLDLHVLWNADKSSIEVTGLYQALSLKVGQSKAYTADNKVISLGAPTLIRDGITYVPTTLFSKAFSLPVGWDGKLDVTVPYTERYLKAVSGRELFWLHKEKGVVYSGESGRRPVRAGIANVRQLDWATLSVRTVNSTSYVLDLNNASGEPHIHVSNYRLLLHEGQLVRQTVSSYGGMRNLGMKENVSAYQGNLVMVNKSILYLVNPDGHIFKTYNLAEPTGIDDTFALEAIEEDFLLVRPYQKGTLFLIDRKSGESTALYTQLLGSEDQAWLEQYPNWDFDYPGDRLQYNGRSGNTLSFTWTSFEDNRQVQFTYTLS